LVFYLALLIESLYFYKNKANIVHHLKIKQKDFAKKVDNTIKVEDEKPKKDPFLDEDIKFT
jgi:hypothetical protein